MTGELVQLGDGAKVMAAEDKVRLTAMKADGQIATVYLSVEQALRLSEWIAEYILGIDDGQEVREE